MKLVLIMAVILQLVCHASGQEAQGVPDSSPPASDGGSSRHNVCSSIFFCHDKESCCFHGSHTVGCCPEGFSCNVGLGICEMETAASVRMAAALTRFTYAMNSTRNISWEPEPPEPDPPFHPHPSCDPKYENCDSGIGSLPTPVLVGLICFLVLLFAGFFYKKCCSGSSVSSGNAPLLR